MARLPAHTRVHQHREYVLQTDYVGHTRYTDNIHDARNNEMGFILPDYLGQKIGGCPIYVVERKLHEQYTRRKGNVRALNS
eukprot:8139738-Pyramimonas_sp.AAC.2